MDYDESMKLFRMVDDATRLEGPHGWIQWKGTNVCMDVRCECGDLHHVDAEFAYYVRCPNNGKTYAVGQYVRLVPMPEDVAAKTDAIAMEAD